MKIEGRPTEISKRIADMRFGTTFWDGEALWIVTDRKLTGCVVCRLRDGYCTELAGDTLVREVSAKVIIEPPYICPPGDLNDE